MHLERGQRTATPSRAREQVGTSAATAAEVNRVHNASRQVTDAEYHLHVAERRGAQVRFAMAGTATRATRGCSVGDVGTKMDIAHQQEVASGCSIFRGKDVMRERSSSGQTWMDVMCVVALIVVTGKAPGETPVVSLMSPAVGEGEQVTMWCHRIT